MDERHLNVRWIDHTAVLLQSITRKLEQEELVDVELVCEGQILKCHRLILSACSPFFDQVFSEQPDPNSNLVIFLKDTKFWELEALVHFMYNGEVEVSQEKLPELFVAAEKLNVKGLADNFYGNSPPPAGSGGEEGRGDGDERSQEEKQQQPDDMVDLLQYGAEANQRSVSGGRHQKQPRKSVLRPLSNLPSLPKLQGMKHKGQLEAPRAANVIKKDRPSLGAASSSSNGANAEHELKIYRQGMKKENEGTRTHRKEKPYICGFPGCTKAYSFQGNLKAHLRSHTGEKPYMCELPGCTKTYSTKDALKIHLKLHSGEKPHMCEFPGCTKAYSRLENLKIHLRFHTGEKPYLCGFPGCTKAFSNGSCRNKHQNRTHSNEKPFVCKVPNCNKRYTDPSSLRKHVKNAHGPDFYTKKKHKGNDHDHQPSPSHRMGRERDIHFHPGNERSPRRSEGMDTKTAGETSTGTDMMNGECPIMDDPFSDNNLSSTNDARPHIG